MPQVIDRESHYCTQEIFNRLGTAINQLQIYTREHPRFRKTAERIEELVNSFFENNRSSKTLTFTLNRRQLEFRSLPIMNLNTHGEALVEALDECGCRGLQFLPGISASEVARLIQTLILYVRSSSTRPTEPPSAGEDSNYRFLYTILDDDLVQAAADDPLPEEVLSAARMLLPTEVSVSPRRVTTTYRSVLHSITNGDEFNLNTLQSATGQVISLLGDRDLEKVPAPLQGYFEEFTVHHSINVCLLTSRAVSLVIKDPEALKKVSVAALLHDIGKSHVPEEILDKPGPLNKTESRQLRSHQRFGAEILLSLPRVEPLNVTVAYGHHLRANGEGLPINWITELVAIIDTFEALTAARPYKEAMSSELAFRTMLSMPNFKDQQPLIKLLYESLGPYPVGTFVELNSGERAAVLEMNACSPRQPTVRILTDEKLRMLDEPVDLDLAEDARKERVPRLIVRTLVQQKADEDLTNIEPRPEPSRILGSALHDCATLMEREG